MSKAKSVTAQDYAKIAATHMVTEVFKFLAFYEKQLGANTSSAVFKQFIKGLTEKAVIDSLNVIPKDKRTDREALDKTRKAFKKLKIAFQDAIAEGYEDAAFKFSGMQVDYYCDIKIVPESEIGTTQ